MEQASPFLLKIYCPTERKSQAASRTTVMRKEEDLSFAKFYMEAFIW